MNEVNFRFLLKIFKENIRIIRVSLHLLCDNSKQRKRELKFYICNLLNARTSTKIKP